jgi:hypothetical protein
MQMVSHTPQPPESMQTGSEQQTGSPPPAPSSQNNGMGLWLRDLFISAIASVLIITFL